MATTRDSLVLGFDTNINRVRTVRIPDPSPMIDQSVVESAGQSIVSANVFDPAAGMTGIPVGLRSAAVERVTTTPVFQL